jgi:hypothetical protein
MRISSGNFWECPEKPKSPPNTATNQTLVLVHRELYQLEGGGVEGAQIFHTSAAEEGSHDKVGERWGCR